MVTASKILNMEANAIFHKDYIELTDEEENKLDELYNKVMKNNPGMKISRLEEYLELMVLEQVQTLNID